MPVARPAISAAAVFATLLWPSWWLYLLALREAYRGLEAAGLITRGGNFWGQILGRNIPSHAEWIGFVARTAAGVAGYAPALAAACWVYLALGRRGIRPPACRRMESWRFLVTLGLFGVLLSLVGRPVSEFLGALIFKWGVAAGCSYTAAGKILVGPGGPFSDDGLGTVFNWVWKYGPWSLAVMTGFVPAMTFFHWLTRGCVTAMAGRCGRCGYETTGLGAGTCPECGTALPPESA